MQAGADEDKIREVPGWRESRRFSEMERMAIENFRGKFNVPLGVESQGFCVLPKAP